LLQSRKEVQKDEMVAIESKFESSSTSLDVPRPVLTQRTNNSLTESNNKPESLKYIMLGLLWLTACLSAIDRIAMSVAIIPMAEEFHFNDTTKGSISSLLSFGYALVILPAGFLAGQWSPRLLMASGIALWSLATIATPLTIVSAASSIGPLLIARMLVGAGESILLPTSTRLLNEWTSLNEKSRGTTSLRCESTALTHRHVDLIPFL
jgi:ACS family sodium-dependent inorganic phosphate cotransporter